MGKIHIGVLVFFGSCFILSCAKMKSNENLAKSLCPTKQLSVQQKLENNLFLKFYCGMPPDEYQREVRILVKSGVLSKEIKPNTTTNADSMTVFSLAVENVNKKQEICMFRVLPYFEDDCQLVNISLDYFSRDHTIATFMHHDFGEVTSETREAPPEGTAENIQKLYNSKYGKSLNYSDDFVPESTSKQFTWNLPNKTVTLEKIYGISSFSGLKNKKRIKSINIKYVNPTFEKRLEITRDSSASVDLQVERKRTLDNVEKSKRSI